MVFRALLGTAAALVGAAALPAQPAHAIGSIGCHGLEGSTARVALTLGASPVPAVLVVRLEAEGRRWSTVAGEEGERLGIAQAFVTEEWLAVDLVDDRATRRIASVRVLRVEEGRRVHQYGYLQLHGVAVHPLSCEGPSGITRVGARWEHGGGGQASTDGWRRCSGGELRFPR